MKIICQLFMLLVMGTILTSCKKSDLAYENKFDQSFNSWLTFKKASLNSYRYKVQSGSWVGIGVETIITVKAGKVVRRDYVRKNIDQTTNQPFVAAKWTEELDSLNTHSAGAPSITLDDIYQKARTEWLIKRKDGKIYFKADDKGIISYCGYVDKNCVDDCFTGIDIVYVEAL